MNDPVRIAMSAAQVREACQEWAARRLASGDTEPIATLLGVPDDMTVTVSLRPKRAYNRKMVQP